MLQLRTLGGVRVISDGKQIRVSRPRELGLLLYIACDRSRRHVRSRLAEMFWPCSDAKHGLHCVSQAIYRLSSEIPGLRFSAEGKAICIPGHILTADVLTFSELLRQGEQFKARDLYGGPFLDGFMLDGVPEFSDWADEVRREVELRAEDMFRALMNRAESEGEWTRAEEAARGLLSLNPYDEVAISLEAALLAQRGERARARKRLEEAAVALESIGHAPSLRLQDLITALKNDDDSFRLETAPLPLIGRSREFERLKAALAAAQIGRGGTVAILGKAGIGKTRLLEQLMRLATLRGFRVLRGAGRPVLQSAAYAGAREILASVNRTDIAQLPPARLEALAHLLPPTAGASAPQESKPLPRDWLYSSAAELLGTMTEGRPLIVALEDLQWIDAATLDLMRYLSVALNGGKVLLVGTARLDELKLSVSDLLPGCASISVSELCDEAARELVEAFRARDGALPDGSAEAVRRRAGGHPLFLLELLKRMRAERPSEAAPERALPDSITEFIAMRLKRLTPVGRATAEALAVLGDGADRADIAAVAQLSDAEFANGVEELIVTGLVRDGAAGVEFLHDLMRDGTVDSMSTTRRQMLHKRALRALRASARRDSFSLVFHAARSGDGPATHRYATAAAQLSERRYGAVEAEPYWRLALTAPPNLQARLLAQEKLAGCLYSQRMNDEAALLYGRILESEHVAPARRVLCEARLLGIRARRGRPVDACELIRVAEAAEALESPVQRLIPYQTLIAAMLVSGHDELVNRYRPGFAQTAILCGPSRARAEVLSSLAEASLLTGRISEAHEYLEAAQAASGASPRDRRSLLLGIRGLAHLVQGDLREANVLFEAAVTEVGKEELADHALLANWSLVKLEQGKFSDCRVTLSRVLSRLTQGATAQRAIARTNLAILCYEEGNSKEAAEEASRAIKECEGNTLPAGAPLGLYGLAIMDRDTSEAARVRTSLEQLINRPAPGHDYSYAAVFWARMAVLNGKSDDAGRILERYADHYSTRDFFCHARLQLEQARLLGMRDREAGLALAREVRARAADAGAVLLLNRSEALIRQLRHGVKAGAAAVGPGESRRGGGRRRRT